MITFKKFILNEMPAPLYKAAQNSNEQQFILELQKAYFDLQSKLQNPEGVKAGAYRVEGARDFSVNQPDNEHMYPYFTFTVDTPEGEKNVEISVPDLPVDQISHFVYKVNGEEKKFATTTGDISKETGHIKPGVSYMLYGVKQAVSGGRRAPSSKSKAGMEEILSKIPTEVLQAELERRMSQGFNAPAGNFDF